MRTLIIILLLFIVGVANAQLSGTLTSLNKELCPRIMIKSEDLKSDTVKVMLLVSAYDDPLTIFGNHYPFIISGYEIFKVTSDTVIWFYLDRNKKPLNKNINVWMSKPMKL